MIPAHLLHAIIYIPAHLPVDGIYTRQALDHIQRRGYQFRTIVQDWAQAIKLTRNGSAQVIVFARHEHFEADFVPRIEFVGQTTQDIPRPDVIRDSAGRAMPGRHKRGRRPRQL